MLTYICILDQLQSLTFGWNKSRRRQEVARNLGLFPGRITLKRTIENWETALDWLLVLK